MLDDAPYCVVIDSQVGVNQTVASGDNHAPGNLRMCGADVIGDTAGRLPYQLQVAEGCVEGHKIIHIAARGQGRTSTAYAASIEMVPKAGLEPARA